MNHLRTEPDGTVTEQWAGREIRNAYRGFWHKGVPQYNVTLRVKPGVRELANPYRYVRGGGDGDWLKKYRAK